MENFFDNRTHITLEPRKLKALTTKQEAADKVVAIRNPREGEVVPWQKNSGYNDSGSFDQHNNSEVVDMKSFAATVGCVWPDLASRKEEDHVSSSSLQTVVFLIYIHTRLLPECEICAAVVYACFS